MNANIRKYYIWNLLSLNVLITPIYVIFLRTLGLSYLEIATLHFLKDVSIILLEVPSGILSDLTSRKMLLILSALFLAASMMVFVLLPTFTFLALSFILWGGAIAFASGSDEALIYESLDEKSDYPQVVSNTSILRRFGGVFTKILGPILYVQNHLMPFIISVIMALVTALLAGTFTETKVKKEKPNKRMYVKQIWIKLKSKEIFSGILSFAIIMGTLNTIFIFQQPKLEVIGIKPVYFSIIYGGFFLAGALGSFLTRFLPKRFSISSFYSLVSLVAMLSILAMGLGKGLSLVLIAMMVQSLLHGLMYPMQNMYINPYLQNEYRSGILSFQSLFQSSVKGCLILGVGALADGVGLTNGILFAGILPLVMGLLWLYVMIKGMHEKTVAKESC